MPTFTYEATDESGRTVTGSLDAPDKNVAVAKLHKDNFFPIYIEQKQEKKRFELELPLKRRILSQQELFNFTQQMATLLKSGLELDRCLAILTDLVERERPRRLVKSIQEAVHAGESLSGAMARQAGVFPALYLNMVKAGEAGGFLDSVFDRLAYYMEGRMKLVTSIRSALIYPSILALAGLSAIFILTAYVIPRFSMIFEDMGGELPAATRLLVSASTLLRGHLVWFVFGAALAVAGVWRYLSTDGGKRRWDSLLLKLPVIGPLTKKIIVSQFTRTLGTLLESGVPVMQSLSIVRDTISNGVVADAVDTAIKGVKEGRSMSSTLRASGIFPSLALHMMLVGEESGKLGDMMLRMSRIYDEEVETAVKRAITVLEPVMILVMGIAVAFVVISMLTAIFSVNDLPF